MKISRKKLAIASQTIQDNLDDFENKLFILSFFITVIFSILVGISWLFDTKPMVCIYIEL